MSNDFSYFINARAEPDVRNRAKRERLQRLSFGQEPIETVFVFFTRPHRAEAPVLMRARYLRLGNL
jgi:hypothetical protein